MSQNGEGIVVPSHPDPRLAPLRLRNEAANVQLGQTITIQLALVEVTPENQKGKPLNLHAFEPPPPPTALSIRFRNPYGHTTLFQTATLVHDIPANPNHNLIEITVDPDTIDMPGIWLMQARVVVPPDRTLLYSSWADLVVFA